MSKLGSS